MKVIIKRFLSFYVFYLFTSIVYGQVIPPCEAEINLDSGVTTVVDFDIPSKQTTPPPPPPPPPTGERLVFWMHGLGGGPGSWQNAGAATQEPLASGQGYPAREVISEYPNLSTTETALSTSAAVLKTQILLTSEALGQDEDERLNNVIIAHSQGGIISRYLDMLYEDPSNAGERRVGGLVTFGSPHQGAQIVNNTIDGSGTSTGSKMGDFFNEACIALKEGPIVELIETNFWLDLFLSGQQVQRLTDPYCQDFADFLPSILSDFSAQITMDYMVGAPEITSLNQYNSNIPRVAFYGIETDPVFWRTYQYLTTSPNNDTYFDAIHDDIGVDFAEENAAKYLAKVEEWTEAGWMMAYLLVGPTGPQADMIEYCQDEGIPILDCPLLEANLFLAVHEMVTLAEAWNNGYEWWNNSDLYWKSVIGAHTITIEQPNSECSCLHESGMGLPLVYNVPNGSDCSNPPSGYEFCIGPTPNYVTVTTEKESDGIVLAESAGNWPNTDAFEMPGSNHQQMRNDNNTKEKLLELWDGGHDTFFETDPQ